jgi:hypothetical protein
MAKNLLVSLVAFLIVFISQSQVWAAAQNVDLIQNNFNIDKSVFFAKDPNNMQQQIEINNLMIHNGNSIFPFSIEGFSVGFGDIGGAILPYYLIFGFVVAISIFILLFILLPRKKSKSVSVNIDAYNMSHEMTKLQQKFDAIIEFVNNIKMSDYGYFSVGVYAF